MQSLFIQLIVDMLWIVKNGKQDVENVQDYIKRQNHI